MKWLKRIGAALGIIVVVLGGVGFYLGSFKINDEADLHLSAKIQQGSLEHAGRTRTFSYYIPAHLAENPAVVFVLHGSNSDGTLARKMNGFTFDQLADRDGFVAVYPDGFAAHWNDCRVAAPYEANRLNIDDVGFLRAIARYFEEQSNADPARIFATGLSNGGQMALRLALEAPDLVRAVAVLGANMPVAENTDCKARGEPVSFMLMNGTSDPMNPYDGGEVALYGVLGSRGHVLSSQATVQYWVDLAGYQAPPVTSRLSDVDPDDGSVIDVSLWSEPGKKSVVLYRVENGGHSIPHPDLRYPRIIGPTNHDIAGPAVIWEFFKNAP